MKRMLPLLVFGLLIVSIVQAEDIYYPGGYLTFYDALDEAVLWASGEETTLHITTSDQIVLNEPYVINDLDFKLSISGTGGGAGTFMVDMPAGSTALSINDCYQLNLSQNRI